MPNPDHAFCRRTLTSRWRFATSCGTALEFSLACLPTLLLALFIGCDSQQKPIAKAVPEPTPGQTVYGKATDYRSFKLVYNSYLQLKSDPTIDALMAWWEPLRKKASELIDENNAFARWLRQKPANGEPVQVVLSPEDAVRLDHFRTKVAACRQELDEVLAGDTLLAAEQAMTEHFTNLNLIYDDLEKHATLEGRRAELPPRLKRTAITQLREVLVDFHKKLSLIERTVLPMQRP